MPKIRASTVVEHRAVQRASLIDAARRLLTADPDQVPNLAAVAAQAGLARSSIYAYFRSRDDMLDAVIVDTFPRWSAYVEARMRKRNSPGERVQAYVDANLHLVARGDHALVRALASTGRTDALVHSSRLLHGQLAEPLRQALAEHGASDPDGIAALVQALVYNLSRQIEEGTTERKAKQLAHELLAPYLATGDPAGHRPNTR